MQHECVWDFFFVAVTPTTYLYIHYTYTTTRTQLLFLIFCRHILFCKCCFVNGKHCFCIKLMTPCGTFDQLFNRENLKQTLFLYLIAQIKCIPHISIYLQQKNNNNIPTVGLYKMQQNFRSKATNKPLFVNNFKKILLNSFFQ